MSDEKRVYGNILDRPPMRPVRTVLESSADRIARKLSRGEYRSEAEANRSNFGKWSQPGVPHKGWTCIADDDVEDDLETCEMCEFAEVRYIHVMTHPEWPGELRVGCYCAQRMEEDPRAAPKREAELKRKARNPDAAADLTWVSAADRIFDANTRAIGTGARVLTEWELEFVTNMQARMLRLSRARTRKYNLTEKQMERFKAIYLRIVGRP
jgi:hypothetical protein